MDFPGCFSCEENNDKAKNAQETLELHLAITLKEKEYCSTRSIYEEQSGIIHMATVIGRTSLVHMTESQ